MIRRALVRVLVVLGVLHVVDGLLMAWLWRNRVAIGKALAAAYVDEQARRRGSGTGEGAPDPRATTPPSAGETCPLCGFVPAE